ncbi:MAG TPA: 3-hydroxyacyl-CoA dehydrogenase/enoyl-CoA hydratase family protein [Terriglobia bacterium]|nr:3-hydroxyacyl-CoA dehydrogenase/enoyl-CoA hydratase family protein [Terriglobia bacterium]
MRGIHKVAVLGAGTMGARIAAHFANASVPCVLLDIVPDAAAPEERKGSLGSNDPEARNRVARAGLEAALSSRPPAFFVTEAARLVAVGNFADHLDWIQDCDWIIEAVTENREIKRALYQKLERFRTPGAVVSSNTSGISIQSLAEGMSEDFRRHFLGTHFFNPPRYMKLLELIPTPETLPEVVKGISDFGDLVLGKGVVIAHDTPNFIANRIGTFFMMDVLHRMSQDGYSIEEIDLLTGPVIGLPKSATFRLLDLVGLDVMVHVVRNLAEALPHDERLDVFSLPEFVEQMLARKLLGEKTGQGFYKKTKSNDASGKNSEIRTLDLSDFEYRERQKPRLPALDMARNIEDAGRRVAALFDSPDRVGEFYRKVFGDTFHYAASRIPEISDDLTSIDDAMKWGFNWEKGVFELWDAIGAEKIVQQWSKEDRPVPQLVQKLLSSKGKTFYISEDGSRRVFDFASGHYEAIVDRQGVVVLAALKDRKKEVKRNPGASLVDLGEGVACLEFHSKMNIIGPDTVGMVHTALKALQEDFEALVIGNQGANFSVGANLMLILMAIQEGEWDEIHQMIRAFQDANMALKYAPKPVVSAPFGLTLGGGLEIMLHSARVRAAAETYMGLVEAGVGLIPAGGGTKEMLVRAMDAVPSDEEADAFMYVKQVFLNIGMAKVSSSAEEARRLGYLSERDSISMNRDRQIADAKQLALDLVKLGYRPGKPRDDIRALGQEAYSKMKLGLHFMRRAERISDYDVVVGTQLAKVLSGGSEFTSSQTVSEQYLLDLEREAFVSLAGQRGTQDRIQHMLKTGKALRN